MKTAIVLLAAILAGCSSDPSMGTGSQTGNAIVAGRLANGGASPLAGTKVYLRPLDWTPSQPVDSSCQRVTQLDSTGRFAFRDLPPRTYRLEARGRNLGWSRTVTAVSGSTAPITDGVLRPMGRLNLHISMTEPLFGAEIELYGLDRSYPLPTSGIAEYRFWIDSLPSGLHTIRLWSPRTNSVIANLPVRIGPDSISRVEYEHGELGIDGPEDDDR